MTRSEAAGLGVAALGHVLLFGALSLSWLRNAPPLVLNDPVEVQLVDEVGLHSAQPEAAVTPPAPSEAPEVGPPAPPEEPKVVEKTKTEAPAPAPSPKPAPKAKPAPLAPAELVLTHKPHESHLARDLALASAGAVAVKKAMGARLGSNFLDGVTDQPSKSVSKTPLAATVDSKALAGLADAIRHQVQPCADKVINPGPGASDIRTKLHLRMNKDGSFASAPEMIAQTGVNDENGRYATRVKELAIGAFTQCAPFHLPPELFRTASGAGWSDIAITYKLP
jgi:hypothetical protein